MIEFLNPKAEDLTGFSSDDARGRRVSEALPLIDEQSGAPVTGPLELALQHNEVVGLDSNTMIRRQDGTTIATISPAC